MCISEQAVIEKWYSGFDTPGPALQTLNCVKIKIELTTFHNALSHLYTVNVYQSFSKCHSQTHAHTQQPCIIECVLVSVSRGTFRNPV